MHFFQTGFTGLLGFYLLAASRKGAAKHLLPAANKIGKFNLVIRVVGLCRNKQVWQDN
jgi:hypothetical protein